MSRFRSLGFLQKSISYNAARKFHKTTFSLVKDGFLHRENSGLTGDFFSTRSLHSWCRGDSGVDVRLLNTGAFLNKRYFHATGSFQQNFYEVLGVAKDANQDDIKNVFQVLAKKWHPDTNKNNPAAKRKFQEIREAFETLRDTEKRAQYDKTLKRSSSAFLKEHNFRRDGADVHVDANISFTQAIFGGKVVVPTITGFVIVQIPKGVQPGHTVVMRSKGFPKHGGSSHGDQYVHFCFKIPKSSSLDERQREPMKEFAKGAWIPPERGDWLNDPENNVVATLVVVLIYIVVAIFSHNNGRR